VYVSVPVRSPTVSLLASIPMTLEPDCLGSVSGALEWGSDGMTARRAA
jgi:hypothetical protein